MQSLCNFHQVTTNIIYDNLHHMIFITGYSSNQNVMHAGNDDSVLNLKRELRDHLATSNGNTADGEEGSTPTATTASTSEQVCINVVLRKA